MLKKAGYDVKVIFIQTSLDTALRRNKESYWLDVEETKEERIRKQY